MRFNCPATDLIGALQVAVKALPARTTNPILEGVLIDASDGEITLTCSDERITIVTRFPAEIEVPGRGVVPGKLFNEVVRRLSEGDVTIAMNDHFMFTVRGSGSRTNIAGQDPDLYPKLPRLDDVREVSLPQDMLKDMIQKTEFAIAVDDMREVLNGCLLEIENGNINMVALDGFRLAIRKEKCSELGEPIAAIIPGRAVGDIGKLLSDDPEAFANLSFGGNKLHIRLEQTDIYVILVEGSFVKYRQIIPKDFATTVVVDLEPLRKGIDRAALIAREGNNNLLILKIADGEMAIESHSQIGDVFEKLDVQQEGGNVNIAFNVKYLTDVVRYVDAEQVRLHLNSPIHPCIITPEGDDNYLHLVLPVRTGATN